MTVFIITGILAWAAAIVGVIAFVAGAGAAEKRSRQEPEPGPELRIVK